MEITYVDSSYLGKNPFLDAERRQVELPSYQNIHALLPTIHWKGHETEVACYNKAWEIAFSNLNNPEPGSGLSIHVGLVIYPDVCQIRVQGI